MSCKLIIRHDCSPPHSKTINPLIDSGFLDPAKTKRQRRNSLAIRCPNREKPTGLSTKINHTLSPLALVHSFFSPQKQYLSAVPYGTALCFPNGPHRSLIFGSAHCLFTRQRANISVSRINPRCDQQKAIFKGMARQRFHQALDISLVARSERDTLIKISQSSPALGLACCFCLHPKCGACIELSSSILACCDCRARAINRLSFLQGIYQPNENGAP